MEIPALNEEAAVEQCVEQALEATARAGVRGEVIVVDNGSTDRTAEFAAQLGARVVLESRRGYGVGRLRGLTVAEGGWAGLLYPDRTYPVEVVGQVVRTMRDEGAGVGLRNRVGRLKERAS